VVKRFFNCIFCSECYFDFGVVDVLDECMHFIVIMEHIRTSKVKKRYAG